MDFEKSIKRLAVIFVASLVVILVAKAMLSKAITTVGTAVAEKKQRAATVSQPAASSVEAPSALEAMAPAASEAPPALTVEAAPLH